MEQKNKSKTTWAILAILVLLVVGAFLIKGKIDHDILTAKVTAAFPTLLSNEGKGEAEFVLNNSYAPVDIGKLEVTFYTPGDADKCGAPTDYKILTNQTCIKEEPTYEIKEICSDVLNNKTAENEKVCANTSVETGTRNVSYECYKPTAIIPMGLVKVRVEATPRFVDLSKCDPKLSGYGYAVDWRPAITLGAEKLEQDKWAWWNTSCNFSQQMNKTGQTDYAWRSSHFNLTSTNFNWTAVNNETGVYVTNSTDQLVGGYKPTEMNFVAKTGKIWINMTPYNDTMMAYTIYYNCSGVPDYSNENNTFWTYEDAEYFGNNATSINGLGWSFAAGSLGAFVNNSWAKYGNWSVRLMTDADATAIRAGSTISYPWTYEGYIWPNTNNSVEDFAGLYMDYSGSTDYQSILSGYNSYYWQRYSSGYVNLEWNVTAQAWTKVMIVCFNSTSTGAWYYVNEKKSAITGACTANTPRALIRENSAEMAYFDNVISYPWYNWSGETDSFGAQTGGTGGGEDSCTYGGSGNWAIDCGDDCALAVTDVGGNNVTIIGTSANECCVTGVKNLKNYKTLIVKNCAIKA